MIIPATEFVDDDLLIPPTELVDDVLMNPATQLANENLMVDVHFDNEFLANDDWLQTMQQKHDIDMMLFGEIIPLQLVEDNPFAATQVSEEETEKKIKTEIKAETKTEIKEDAAKEAQQQKALIAEQKEETEKEEETEAKKEVCKGNAETEIEIEAEKEEKQKKALTAEQKDRNKCCSENIFNSNIDFQCAGTHIDYEEELNFIETWLATPCLDEIYTEDVDMNDKDDMHDEHVNEIFRYWSFEEIRYYSNLMLQQIDDEKHTTEDNMW